MDLYQYIGKEDCTADNEEDYNLDAAWTIEDEDEDADAVEGDQYDDG